MNTYLQYAKRRITNRIKKKFKSIKRLEKTPLDANTVIISNVSDIYFICETMVYPFYWYEQDLKKELGISFVEILTTSVAKEAENYLDNNQTNIKNFANIERIFFLPEFEMEAERIVKTLRYLKVVYPKAKIAFMDWYAPLTLKFSVIVDEYIDFYIKKQVYNEYQDYTKPVLGDTNLSHYYASKHHLELPESRFQLPENFEKKVVLWGNFGLSALLVDRFLQPLDLAKQKPIDLHSRVVVNGVPWYKAMRQEAKDAVKSLSNSELSVISEGLVSRSKYFQEMGSSKLCFSPFGYGEVCWRDYEAFGFGALLLKPDMSHLKVCPDTFIPYETYVPLEWDLSDLREKAVEYSQNESERKRIITNAFEVIRDSIDNRACISVLEKFYD